MHDPRIKAAVIADPCLRSTVHAGRVATCDRARSALGLHVQRQRHHALDGVSPANVAAINRDLPGPREFHVVEDATHYAFLAPCRPQPDPTISAICLDAPGFDRAEFHRTLDNRVQAFFRTHLDEAAER